MDVQAWLNDTEQSGRMVGDGGSVEWSDDDAVKSGSNTEGDVPDEPQPVKKEEKRNFRTPITTLNMKSDPISTILDKIDAEISALSRSQSSAATGSTVIQRPSSSNRSRSPSRQEEELTRGQLDRPGPMKATQKFDNSFSGSHHGRESPSINGDHRGNESQYTYGDHRGRQSPSINGDHRGRQSPSINGDYRGRQSPSINGNHRDRQSPSINGDHRGRQSPMVNGDFRLNGAADMYSNSSHNNEDSQRRPQETDSAHNVDEKFKQILRKRSGYSDNKSTAPSDTETIRTEDFNRHFQDALVYSSDESTVENNSDADESSSDSEKTPKGEDSLLWDYFDTVPKCVSGFKDDEPQSCDKAENGSKENGEGPDSRSIIERLRPKRARSSPPVYNKQKPTNNHTSQNAPRKPTYVSDAESVRTEDFEFRFKDLIVNQMDSEADLTDTDPLHAKVKEILQVTLPYRKNERERTQSENALSLRDRRKDFMNGDIQRSSPRENNPRVKDRRTELMNGEEQLPSPRETTNKSSSSTRHTSRRDSLDDERREIERESERIQREIEMERRGHSFSPRRTKSPTRGMLSITGELPKASSYTDLSNEGRNSPRESASSTPSRTSSLLERARTGLFQDRFSPASYDSPEGRSRSSSSPDRTNSTPDRNSPLRDKFSTSTPNRPSSPSRAGTSSNSPNRDKVRNGPDMEWASPVHSNLSSPRYTSSQIDQTSPRNLEDKLSVSFHDLPNSPNQSTNKYSEDKTSSYINNLGSDSNRANCRSNSLDRERPREGLVSAMKGSRSEVKEAEKKLQLIKAQTDEAKTQLMLTELKRENIMKDIDRIDEDLSRKKRQVKNYEDQLRSRLGDIRASDSFVDTDEKVTSLEEENASLKVRLRHMDGLELERDELVRQLDSAKEDLFNEQRQSRNKIEELQEELENLTAQVEEFKMNPSQALNTSTSLHFQKLEDKVSRLEKDKSDLVQDKKKLLEDLRVISSSAQFDPDRRQILSRDVEELRNEVTTLHSKIGACQKEINNKEDIIGRLKQQNQDLQQMYSKEKGNKDGVMEDHKRSLQTLRKEMDSAMVQVRENMFLEKQKALEDLRSTLEKEKRDALVRAEDKMNNQIKSQSNAIRDKEGELTRMIDLVKKLEEDRREVEIRVKSESQKQIDDILKKEKLKLEADFEWRIHKEKDQVQQEMKIQFNAVAKELEEEKKVKGQFLAQIEKLTTELETQRLQNRQAVHDRMVAVARAKEAIKQDMQVDMEKLKSKMKEDFQQEVDKLQDTIRMQEEEIKQLRAERAEVLKIAKDNQASERVERTIVNEINEECRKNSHMLGISPRKVNMTEFRENGFTSTGRLRTPTTAALANLRACNQELRNHVSELKQEVEQQKNQMIQSQREKADIVQSVKNQLEREKSFELDKLKEKFVKGNPPNGYKTGYHNDVRIPYTKGPPYEYGPRATSQEQELERLEREIKRLTNNRQQRYQNSFVEDDISTAKTINNLRNKVAELEQENCNLSKYSYSVPDLSDPVIYRRTNSSMRLTMRSASPTPQQERIVNVLEQRAKLGDFESDTMLDQQQRNRNMMSQKMKEMTTLQNSLTSQTKDLIHLGQAYSKLNNSFRYGKT